jgi:alpha-1,2-mannosyltransferase
VSPARARFAAWAVGASAAAGYLVVLLVWRTAMLTEIDALIYRFGAIAAWHGGPLYRDGLDGHPRLVFNYPPFAALCFLPLAALPRVALVIPLAALAGNLAVLICLVRRCLLVVGVARGPDLRAFTALGTGALLWLEPVRTHLALGQVGLLLMALILADLTASRGDARFGGIGVGIAAGIKLTPLLFIAYLLAIRRTRAAVVATLTFGVTVAVGFVALPADSRRYWLDGGFGDTTRIAPLRTPGNVSLRGALIRLGDPSVARWLTIAAAVAVLALWAAARAYRAGAPLLAIALVGMASCAVCPFSWAYHWVWLAPLTIHLAARPTRPARIAATLLFVSCAAWLTALPSPRSNRIPPGGLVTLAHHGVLGQLAHDWYLIVFALAVGYATAVSTRSSASTASSSSAVVTVSGGRKRMPLRPVPMMSTRSRRTSSSRTRSRS